MATAKVEEVCGQEELCTSEATVETASQPRDDGALAKAQGPP